MIVFSSPNHDASEARRADIPAIQAFYESNPAYTRLVEGAMVQPGAAELEFDDTPPPELGFDRKWWLLVHDRASGRLDALIDVVKDLMAPGIWHIGLFFVAEALHGQGTATTLHAALEEWARRGGARWLRLGVVAQNGRAARFWRRRGYHFVRSREVAASTGRVNTVWVLVKPLGDDTLASYLAVQTRDVMEVEPAQWKLPAGD